jgi:chemosensory pili system protein ChpA (sensor histidine kinase/response regulator)
MFILMPPIDDTVKGFIEEVKSYIGPITEGIRSYSEKSDQWDTLEEIHRLVHTIKGASSLLDFMGLSHIAAEMEKALDELFSGKITFSESVLNTMLQTVDQIETYCEEITTGEIDDKTKVRETISAYRRMRGLPEDGDEDAADLVWGSTPDLGDDSFSEIDAGLDKEEDFFKDLMESFYVEAEEHMENTARFLNILDSQVQAPTEITPSQRDAIKEIRRSVHTVKGAAGMVKLSEISKWAHEIEDLLDWLYEEANKIDRPLIELLFDGTDLLRLFLSDPLQVDSEKQNTIRKKFKEISGNTINEEDESIAGQVPEINADVIQEKESVEIFEQEPDKVNLEEYVKAAGDISHGKTLRVKMEKVDDLVNLAGELSIALSGCEQKMELFTNSLSELEFSRDRLRTIARDLETDYEVKAIQGLGTGFASAIAGDKNAIQTGVFEEFDSLELDRYSEFNLMIRSLAEAVVDMGVLNTQMLSIYSDLDGFLNRQRVLLGELQNNMMGIRMTPMSSISNRMRQTVREVSRDLGKQIKLIVEGEEIELDRQIWDKLIDPLMHILRNSIDHGIETQAERQELGKPAVGTIKIWSAREGNQVVIRIADDGIGIDHETIRDKVRATGLRDNVDEMSDEELALMIFQSGFSTSGNVTQFSGRGVGLDVVKNNIESLKGSVRIHSVKNQGVQFSIRVPLTLAVAEALLFAFDKQQYAIPLNDVSEVFRVNPGSITGDMEGELDVEGESLPFYNLGKILNKDNTTGAKLDVADYKNVLVLNIGDRRVAVAIENMIGKREIVIKNLGSHLKYVKGISGATILGDGNVVPILNIEELIGAGTIIADGSEADFTPIISKQLEILVVDDSVSVRQVVARLLESQGWKVQTAKDGVEALEKIRESQPDLIVLDIEMPRMNGYEFLNAINVQPRFKNTPVVMLTSRATSKHREKAISLGAKGFVVKPYKDDEFVEIIMRLTGESN